MDESILISRLIKQELKVKTVEKVDLLALAQRPRDHRCLYVLGDSNFTLPPMAAAEAVAAGLALKALDLAGDEHLAAAAREALPRDLKVGKKAVGLMGSTKVVTEKKALKRLGSEMTDDMKLLQAKNERKEREEERRRGKALSLSVDSEA